MKDFTANLLGVVGLEVASRLDQVAKEVLKHSGETAAAVVVIGYGLGPSNDELRQILGLSHPGCVRLLDRLVAEGVVSRLEGQDRRKVALYLTDEGQSIREKLLSERLASIRPLLDPLTSQESETLALVLHKILSSMPTTDLKRKMLCRLCDDRKCGNCPIPAEFRSEDTKE